MFLLIAAIGREIVRFGNNAFNMNDLKVLIKLCRDILAGNHQGRDNQRLYMVADWDMNHFRSLPDASFVDNGPLLPRRLLVAVQICVAKVKIRRHHHRGWR